MRPISVFLLLIISVGLGPSVFGAEADSLGLYSGFRRSLGAKSVYGYRVVTRPEPVREGKKSERFELRRGDCTKTADWDDCANDRERSEVVQQKPFSVPGKEYWYSWSIFVPENFVNIYPVKVCMAQFHQEGSAHPPLMFQNGVGGYWVDPNQMGQKPELLIAEKDFKGKWHDIILQAKWSKGKEGFLRLWVNGELKFSRTGANLLQGGDIFFKYGLYRSFLSRKKDQIPNQVIYFDAVRWGLSRKDVETNPNSEFPAGPRANRTDRD